MDCTAAIKVRQLLNGACHGGRYHSCMRFAAWLLVLAAVLAPRAFAQSPSVVQSLPDLGSGEAILSPVMERRLGEQIMREIRFGDPSYVDDPEISDYLAQIGSRPTRPRQDLGFFCLPGPSL